MSKSDVTVDRIRSAYKKHNIVPVHSWSCAMYGSDCGCPMAVLAIDAAGGYEQFDLYRDAHGLFDVRAEVAELLEVPIEWVHGFIDGFDQPEAPSYQALKSFYMPSVATPEQITDFTEGHALGITVNEALFPREPASCSV